MEYWDNKGQIYNDYWRNLSAQEKAYNFLLSKFGDVKKKS